MAHATQDAIASYLTDMLALERHLQKALAGQIDALPKDALDMGWEMSRIYETCRRHADALEKLAKEREQTGHGFASSLKKAASSVLGLGAAAVDMVRTEKLPRNLRDDFTALSLACIGYVMLYTTSMTLGDTDAADLAQRHLKSHTKSIMSLQHIVPLAVVQFLRDGGLPVNENRMPEIDRTIHAAWWPEELAVQSFTRAWRA
jgi:ferritin-like metal-binding protein YciE